MFITLSPNQNYLFCLIFVFITLFSSHNNLISLFLVYNIVPWQNNMFFLIFMFITMSVSLNNFWTWKDSRTKSGVVFLSHSLSLSLSLFFYFCSLSLSFGGASFTNIHPHTISLSLSLSLFFFLFSLSLLHTLLQLYIPVILGVKGFNLFCYYSINWLHHATLLFILHTLLQLSTPAI